MLVEAALRGSLCVLMFGVCTEAQAAEEAVPDPEFIEYLGMWEESDEEWQMLEGRLADDLEQKKDESSHEQESVENEDEA